MPAKKWFKAKKYGFGWYPATWEGWLIVGIYVVLEIKLAFIYSERLKDPRFDQTVSTVIFCILTAILTAVLIKISYYKGERPSWRWPASTRSNRGEGKKKSA